MYAKEAMARICLELWLALLRNDSLISWKGAFAEIWSTSYGRTNRGTCTVSPLGARYWSASYSSTLKRLNLGCHIFRCSFKQLWNAEVCKGSSLRIMGGFTFLVTFFLKYVRRNLSCVINKICLSHQEALRDFCSSRDPINIYLILAVREKKMLIIHLVTGK